MNWKLFQKDGHFTTKDPAATLYAKGQISFNTTVSRRWVKRRQYCQILFDEEEKKIGIKLLGDGFLDVQEGKEDEIRKITRHNWNGTLYVNCATVIRGLLRTLPIRPLRFKPEWNEDEQIIVIDLKNPIIK